MQEAARILQQNGKLAMLTLIASIVTLMLATRPYFGIWHDAILYTGQAIKLLHPQSYVNDLFFMNGSQDSYTLFTNFYALFIDWLGINTAAISLVIAGQLLWVTAVFSLIRKLLTPSLHWITLATALLCLVYYSDNSIFMVRESFVTSRIFAESLVIFTLTALLNRKSLAASMLLIAAMLIHPLIGLTGLILIYFVLLIQNPRPVLIAGVIAVTLVFTLGLLNIGPAKGLFIPVDEKWHAITSARSSHLYTTTWHWTFWNSIFITIAFLIYAIPRINNDLALFVKAVVIGTILSLIISWFSSETLSSVLIVQLQLWRILWLTQLIALIAAVYLAWRAWNKEVDYLPLLGFFAAWLFLDSMGGIIAIATCIYTYTRMQIAINRTLPLGIIFGVLFLGILEHLALGWIYTSKTFLIQLSDIANITEQNKLNNYIIQSLVILVALGSILTMVFTHSGNRISRTVPAVASILALVFVSSQWDMRQNIPLTFKELGRDELALRTQIKPDETVYWTDSPYLTWFMLRRSSYYSVAQTAGLIFNRDTALKAIDRHINTNHLYHMPPNGDSLAKHGRRKRPAELTYTDLTSTCSDPELDWLVIDKKFSEKRMSYSTGEGHLWYFYKCRDFRRRAHTGEG